MGVLQRLLDFLELRPFFTMRSLRIFWWMYIAVELRRLYFQIWQIFFGPVYRSIQTFINPLDTFMQIAATRLLLEILLALAACCAAKYGARVLQRSQPAESALAQLRAFFDLGPCFTTRLLKIFWFMFLIIQLRAVFFILQPGVALWRPDEWAFDVWGTMLTQLVYVTAYTAGMRLLVEVQRVFLGRDEAAADRILSN